MKIIRPPCTPKSVVRTQLLRPWRPVIHGASRISLHGLIALSLILPQFAAIAAPTSGPDGQSASQKYAPGDSLPKENAYLPPTLTHPGLRRVDPTNLVEFAHSDAARARFLQVSTFEIAGGTWVDRDPGLIGTGFVFNPNVPGGTIDEVEITGPPGWNADNTFRCGRFQPPGMATNRAVCFDLILPVTGDYTARATVAGQMFERTFFIDATDQLSTPQITNLTISPDEVTFEWTAPSAAKSFMVRVNQSPFTGTIEGEKVVSGTSRSATLSDLVLLGGNEYQAVVWGFSQDVRTPGPIVGQFNLAFNLASDDNFFTMPVRIDSIEFTQATQELQSLDDLKADLAADGEPPVAIVALKPAVLRVYMEEVGTVTQVRVRARIPGVLSRERTITLQPGCTPEESRKQDGNCLSVDFYFGPPEGSWTATVATFDMQGNEIESHDFTLTSRTVKPILQVPVSVCHFLIIGGPGGNCEDGRNLNNFLPLLRASAPTHRVQMVGEIRTAIVGDGLLGNAWWGEVWLIINSLWVADGSPDRFYHGMAPRDAPGNAGGIGLFNAAASRVRSLTGRGFEVTEGTVAHETGHMLGRNHTGKADPEPPCVSSSFFPLLPRDWPHTDNRIQNVGFNVARGEALDPQNVFDWMSYCPPPIWVSPHTYGKVMEALRNPGSAHAQSLVQGTFWQLTGFIEDSDLDLRPLFVIQASGPVGAGTGSHRIDVLDANGSLLFTRFFDPAVIHTDPAVTTNGTFGEEFVVRFFSELVPVQAAAARIVIEDPDGIELARLDLEGEPPRVNITFPEGGENLVGNQELAWAVEDPDSESHVFRVHYSPDGGVTIHVLATDISEMRLLVNFEDLPGCSGDCLIRVLASDGVNTGVGVADDFTVPTKPPLAEILFPGDGSVFQLADLAWLQGFGWDPDDGYLGTAATQWFSSLDGLLGNGDELPITALREGTHVVTFTATDSDGNSASDSITVQVDGTDPALDLSILPDGIPANCVQATIDAGDEAGGSGLGAVEFSLDGGETFESIPLQDLPFSFLVPGRGFFHVVARAVDKAGNLAASDERFFIDAGCADLAITKVDNPDPITLGQDLTYTVTVSNGGPSDASGVTVTDQLPAEVAFVSATASQGGCTEDNGSLTCILGTLPTEGTAKVTINVRTSEPGNITNAASVSGNETDPDASDNVASESTTVFVAIDIKPGSEPNAINSKGKGNISVAILSTTTFAAPNEVDKSSLTFGRTGDEESLHRRGKEEIPNCSAEDINSDGLADLVCRFDSQETGFVAGDTVGILKGLLVVGTPIEGRDAVVIVP